jgi:cysteine desulfurase
MESQGNPVTAAPSRPIYLDNSSTTRCDPRVVDAMLPFFTEQFGNAHSRSHAYGWTSEKAVDAAREQVAALVNARESEIVFTSGGTESCNLAIFGVARMYADNGKHIVSTNVEHRAAMDPLRALEREGFEVTYLPVDQTGSLDPQQVANALRGDTILVSTIFGNNEVGTVIPPGPIGAMCKEKGIVYHVDACLGLDTEAIDVDRDGIDLLSMSGHKMYGPKGIGALYVRRRKPRVRLHALILGGGQERGFRHGTLNTPGIVGMGMAAELCRTERDADKARITGLAKRLKDGLFQELDYLHQNGHPDSRLPGVLNISFEYIEGESLMMGMKGIAVSSGSACTSATLEPSHVMRALGVGEELVHTSIRFSLGRFTTNEEIDTALRLAVDSAKRLREMSPLYEMVKDGIDLSSIEWKHD